MVWMPRCGVRSAQRANPTKDIERRMEFSIRLFCSIASSRFIVGAPSIARQELVPHKPHRFRFDLVGFTLIEYDQPRQKWLKIGFVFLDTYALSLAFLRKNWVRFVI
jgi:hypothetical protein